MEGPLVIPSASVALPTPIATPSSEFSPSFARCGGDIEDLSATYKPTSCLLTPPSTSPLVRTAPLGYNFPKLVIPPVTNGTSEALVHARIQDMALKGEEEGAFFAADLGEVYKSWKLWKDCLPRVELFYAVKCNPDPVVLHLLSLLGTGFDCASYSEISNVLSLPNPPSPESIIFANPCKPASFIRHARELHVDAMTFDNTDELIKIAKLHPQAKLVLRMLTDDSKSLCRLGLKFGAPVDSCLALLTLAKTLGLSVIGVSFHVGSGCKDPQMFDDAILRARKVFDMGREVGYDFGLLDVGGGFEKENFVAMAGVLNEALERHFPAADGVRVIGEPGRFLVSTAFTLATNVVARRAAPATALANPGGGQTWPRSSTPETDDEMMIPAEMASSIVSLDGSKEGSMHLGDAGLEEEDSPKVMYYINDGVYGSFNCIMFDHQIVHPFPLTLEGGLQRCPFPSAFPPNIQLEEDLTVQMGYAASRGQAELASIWGPTCDSIDCVRNVVTLPKALEVGDWLGWGEMGAYTICAASTFNGFNKSPVYYTTGSDAAAAQEVARVLQTVV